MISFTARQNLFYKLHVLGASNIWKVPTARRETFEKKNVVPSFLNFACSTEIQLLVLCEGRPRGYRCAYQYVRDMWINI